MSNSLGWECSGENDDGVCLSATSNETYSALFDDVASANWQTAASNGSRAERAEDPYSFYGEPDGSAEQDDAPIMVPEQQRMSELPQSATLQKGMVLYDIARQSLMARSAITGEPTDRDSILRECNRIMVLNGYPDAQLEGKSKITTADLPRAWNNVRWNQEFKLYDSSEAVQPAAPEQAAPEQAAPEQPAETEAEHPPENSTFPTPSGAAVDPDSFFICQFRDERFNPNGPSSSNDCGPASLAMIARRYDVQFTDTGTGEAIDSGDVDPAKLVRSVRFLMTGSRNEHDLTGLQQIEKAAHEMGFETSAVESLFDLDAQLAAGRLVVLAGNPKDYQKDLGLRYGKGGTIYNGGHFITVVGKQGDDYIVNDPATHGGSMVLTREQISAYVSYVKPQNMGAAVYPR